MTFAISYQACIVLIVILVVSLFCKYNPHFRFWIADKKTKDVEINPKWVTNELQGKYYGFHDLDIVLVNDPFDMLPRFRLKKHTNKLQLLISEDTTIRDLDDIARIALAGKIKIKYGVWYPEKSTQWLAILNYLLDGGDVKIDRTNWEDLDMNKQKDKKPVDL